MLCLIKSTTNGEKYGYKVASNLLYLSGMLTISLIMIVKKYYNMMLTYFNDNISGLKNVIQKGSICIIKLLYLV